MRYATLNSAHRSRRATRRVREVPVAIAAAFALLLATAGAAPGQIPFSDAEVFFEENTTDGDLGIHICWDGEAWEDVTVRGPDGRRIFNVRNNGTLREIGSTSVFTESAEPSFDELPREEFLELFEEGEYRFSGRTVEGERMTGTGELSHVMPAPPVVLSPASGEVVDPNDPLVIEWSTVPDPPGAGNEITGYQVIIEQEEPLRVFSVDLPPSATCTTVPPEFIEAELDTKGEVIAVSANGNKTITEFAFEVEEP